MKKEGVSNDLIRLEFASVIVAQLNKYDISCVLVGGACVSIYTNEKYWIKLKVKGIDDSKISVTSNNGRIYQSDINGYDYMFIPEQDRQMTIGIYKKLEKLEICGEIEINDVKNK